MHILIATAGVLPAAAVADLAARMMIEGGRATVVTVIEVPHSFLDSLLDEEWRPFDLEGEPTAGREAELAARYVEERGRRLAEPVLAALQSRGVEAETVYMEGSDPAQTIIATAEELEVDMIVMGATRPLFDEESWASVSVQVMHRAPCPLLLVPGAGRTGEERENHEVVTDPQPAES